MLGGAVLPSGRLPPALAAGRHASGRHGAGRETAVSTAPGPLSGAGGVLPSLLLLTYAVGAFAPPRRSQWVFGLTLVVAAVNDVVTPGNASTLPFGLLFVGVLPYVLGRMMRARAERAAAQRSEAERIDAERDIRAKSAVSEERVRIARELHDVIAHSVSIMVIQAGGARIVREASPERAEASLRSVERAGRDALAEMRRLLGLLDGGRRGIGAPARTGRTAAPVVAGQGGWSQHDTARRGRSAADLGCARSVRLPGSTGGPDQRGKVRRAGPRRHQCPLARAHGGTRDLRRRPWAQPRRPGPERSRPGRHARARRAPWRLPLHRSAGRRFHRARPAALDHEARPL